MTLVFTPPAPSWADEDQVTDQHGNLYEYDAACETLRAAVTPISVACPTASVEAGNAPTATPSAPATPPSNPQAGQLHFESYDDARNTFCYDGDWNFIDQFPLGIAAQTVIPCPSASVEEGDAPTTSPTAPVTPPSNPLPGQEHFESYDDAVNIWCWDGADWTLALHAPMTAGTGIEVTSGLGGNGSISANQNFTVSLVARRPDMTYGLFTLSGSDGSQGA